MLIRNANGPRNSTKTITFTGAAGAGAVGSVAIFTVTGQVIIEKISGICTTNLAGATATLALGVTGSTSLFIGATTATGIVTTAAIWVSTTPTAGGLAMPAATKDIIVNANIIGTVATANITAGVIRFDVQWRPLSSNGNVA